MSSPRKNADRLSSLPDEVLSHILSSMPTKYAVRTSSLSKRWRYNWTTVTNLDFDDIHSFQGLDCFSEFVNRVLKLLKTSKVKLLRLRFLEMWVKKSCVSNLIDKAVGLNVCEIDVQAYYFDFPPNIFTCKTLTKLRIIESSQSMKVLTFPTSVMLPCLKTLDICVFEKPYLSAFRLVNGSPVLESLSLKVTWRSEEEDYNFNIPTLKRFELRTTKVISIINKVVLNLPNLEYVFVGGRLCSLFVIEDLSSLVDANISFDEIRFNHLYAELLQGLISGAKSSLFLSTRNFDVPLNTPQLKFPYLKHLELKGSFPGWPKIFQFLECFINLEYLSIEECCDYIGHIMKPGESCWIEPLSVPDCMLLKLKTMKLTYFKGQKCGLLFLEYMLGKAEYLKGLKLTTCKSLCLEEEMVLCAQLLKFPMASKFCEIDFFGNFFRSTGN